MPQRTHTLANGFVVFWGNDLVLGWFLEVHESRRCNIFSIIKGESTRHTGLTLTKMNAELISLGVPRDLFGPIERPLIV